MMQCEQQHMLLWGKPTGYVEPEQRDPQQRATREIKGTLCLQTLELAHQAVNGQIPPAREVDDWDLDGQLRFDDLNRASQTLLKGCAQDFVPLPQRLQTLFQRRDVQLARKTQGDGDIVPGAPRIPLMQEPQALLRKGERQISGALHRHKGRNKRG